MWLDYFFKGVGRVRGRRREDNGVGDEVCGDGGGVDDDVGNGDKALEFYVATFRENGEWFGFV